MLNNSQVQAEMDDLIAAECPFCGDIMIRNIDKPFIEDADFQRVINEWLWEIILCFIILCFILISLVLNCYYTCFNSLIMPEVSRVFLSWSAWYVDDKYFIIIFLWMFFSVSESHQLALRTFPVCQLQLWALIGNWQGNSDYFYP